MKLYRIQRYKTTLTIPADGTSIVSSSIEFNGILRGVFLDVPNMVGVGTTLTVAIKDADGFDIFSQAAIAENAKEAIKYDSNSRPLERPLSGLHTITLTASAAQTGAAQAIPVVLLIDK